MAQAVASASKVPPTPSTLSRADKIRFNDLIKRAKELEGSENADDVKVRVPFEDVVASEWRPSGTRECGTHVTPRAGGGVALPRGPRDRAEQHKAAAQG